MAGKKKNDFWDDVDELDTVDSPSGDSHTAKTIKDEEWSAVKSLPLKIIMRLLLMAACLVALASAYIAYEYVGDRYAGGSYSTSFYNSGSFAAEYNKSVDQLLQLLQAMEADSSVTQVGNEELLTTLVENYMGKDTNFSFMILDSDNYKIASSGDDAKDRIQASNHYVVISNADGEAAVQSPISGKLLNKDAWNKALAETSNTYIIYSAVDNELTQNDAFYKAEQSFEKMEGYFSIARFVGIIAVVIFVICLIFCIMATGMKRGYDHVCLSWFDKIFTEIALVIMAAVTVALAYGIKKLMGMSGDVYRLAALGLVVLTYIWVIRSYFSIVRRIKAGRLLKSSIIGTIIGAGAGVVGKLPSPLNVIVGALLLIIINGALVCGVIFMRQYTVKGIPIMFIVAPVVFVIELLALLSRGSDDEEEEEAVLEQAAVPAEDEDDDMKIAEPIEHRRPAPIQAEKEPEEEAAPEEQMDWEALDLGKAIEEAERNRANQMKETAPVEETFVQDMAETVYPSPAEELRVSDKTEVLSVEDVEKALRASGLTPDVGMTEKAENKEEPAQPQVVRIEEEKAPVMADDDGRVNFVQLNKEVRKEFKAALKGRGIGVTVRAPEKPVIIDIDRNSLHIIISDIFAQIDRLAAKDTRTYVEVYLQDGKVVYIVKIPVADDKQTDAAAAVAGDGSFDNARKIIEANAGRFVVTLDNGVLKAGMLIDAAE